MEVEMIELKASMMIKASYEMDINTKHLITWIGFDEIVDFKDADTFNGVVVLTTRNDQEVYYIHNATSEELQHSIDKLKYMEKSARHLAGLLGGYNDQN
jgi:hypothetical protein